MSTANYFHQQCNNQEHMTNVTNYCASLECLKPLCPECIQEHYQFHTANKTTAGIQSITNTRVNCEKKVLTAIQNLQKEIAQYDVQYIFNPDEVLRQEISKMEQAREQMIEIIDLFFQQQENTLQTKVKENCLKVSDILMQVKNIGGIFQKIDEVIGQLDSLRTNIRSSDDPFPYFSKTCRLDVKSLLDRYKSDLKKVISSRELDPINVHIDEHRLFNLKTELSKIVTVMTHGHEELNDSQNSNAFVETIPPQPAKTQPTNQSRQPTQQQYKPTGDEHQPDYAATVPSSNPFQITKPNYFTAPQKILHFFLARDKSISTINLDTLKFEIIPLQSEVPIPNFHRSLALPNGDIYLSGGNNNDNTKDAMVKKLSLGQSRQLVNVSCMKVPRSSHTMVYCNNLIYFIGGYIESRKLTNTVECYNIAKQRMDMCQSCIHPANSPTCCAFNDKYIYKFGGNDQNGQLVLAIERYDTLANTWEIVDPHLDQNDLENFQGLFQYAACCQISPKKIFVFGGYDNMDKGTDFSFILEIEENQHKITQTHIKPLPYAEGFWNNQVIIFNSKLYVLQNIEIDNNQVDEQNRCLLSFDGNTWNEVQYKH